MPRDIPVGNGNMLVAFDRNYILREFYFPHIGQENHATGEPFRFGAWVNGSFIIAVQEYINKLLEIEKCRACKDSKYIKYAREGEG